MAYASVGELHQDLEANGFDDIICYGNSFDSALINLKAIFQRLREAGLRLKPKKCKLLQQSVRFLGHVVSAQGVAPDPDKIQAVRDWSVPQTVKEVRGFVGFTSYYRKFINNFAQIMHPITELTGKKKKFVWTSECQLAFEKVKFLLTSPPLLVYPQDDSCFILDTDASSHGLGGVLSQVQGGEERVIAYASRVLSEAQSRYCTTYRELLALVVFFKHFRQYLWGRHFKVRTDHAALKWLLTFHEPEGMLARWLSVIATYDFEVEHRKGVNHSNADGLSRLRCKSFNCPSCDEFSGIDKKDDGCQDKPEKVTQVNALTGCPNSTDNGPTNWMDTWGPDQLRRWQNEDPAICTMLQMKAFSQYKPADLSRYNVNATCQRLIYDWDLLEIQDGILYRQWVVEDEHSPLWLIVAPEALRRTLFYHLHEARTAGHLGTTRTLKEMRRRFYWPGLERDVRNWCRWCLTCAKRKPPHGEKKGYLKQTFANAPMERVAMDIVGPLPRTANGNEYILVVCDYFTKWVECYALPDHQAQTVADAVVSNFVSRFGVPSVIHSDQGREFESRLFEEVCQLLGIEKTRTTPYHFQSDGLVERFNRTLQQMLSAFVNKERDDWDEHLPYVTMAYRATVHESTKFSPNRLMLGRETNLPLDLMVGPPPNSKKNACYGEYVEWLKRTMENSCVEAQNFMKRAALRQKRNYDKTVVPYNFQRGDWVWYFYPPKAKQKLGQGWTGPFLVVGSLNNLLYRIQRTSSEGVKVVHVDNLRKFEAKTMPSSWLETSSSLPPSTNGD